MMQKPNPTLDDLALKEHVIMEKSELSQAFDSLDARKVDPKTGMSELDTNSRLTTRQVTLVMRYGALVRWGIFRNDTSLAEDLKALMVSANGLGRREKVEIAVADRGAKLGNNGWQGLKGLFTPRE